MDITAYVEENGDPEPGHHIHFSVSPEGGGYCEPAEQDTNEFGDANVVFHSGSTAGTVWIKATDTSHNNDYAQNWIIVSVPTAPSVTDGGQYTTSTSQLSASCTPTGKSEYKYAIGTDVFDETGWDSVCGWTPNGSSASLNATGLTLANGETYYFSVKYKDTNGCWSAVGSSDGITVDATAPDPGAASSPAYVTTASITVTYSGASDALSGLNHVELWYKKGVHGTWTDSTLTSTAGSGSFLPFAPDDYGTYYFDLVAEDNVGNRSAAPSGDGDDSTIYEPGENPSGRVFLHTEYLYPGGPAIRVSLHDTDGSKFRETTNVYGPEGELISRSGSAETVEYEYDALYRVKSIADGKDQTTQYDYDEVGNLVSVEYPGGETVQFTEHDPAGRVLERVDPKEVVTKYHYDDPEGLLTHIEYPATSALDVEFTYDATYGRLTQMSDATGVTEYSDYDDLDIAHAVTTTYTDLPARAIEYEYWPNGSIDSIYCSALPGTGTFSYTYDDAGRPDTLTNPFGQEFSWGYLDNNWLNTQTSPVTQATYTRNPRGMLTSLVNRKTDETLLSSYATMTYDPAGDILSMPVSVPNVASQYSGTSTYTYDTKNQLLTEASTRNGSYSYTFVYDAAGNPTTFEGDSRSFNENNQNTDFTFDDNGNPITYNSTTLTYDPEDRMTAYGTALTAGYTGDGLRAWKQVGGTPTYFLYSGGVPIAEMESDGDVIAVNTFGPYGLLARYADESTSYYTFDPQGNVSQVLESDGDIASSQLYDAYGTSLYGSAAYPYGFGSQSGYYTDAETGLQLLTHRYYDPDEGRFLNRDPIGYAGGMNLYAYVGNNPVNDLDPAGLCPANGTDDDRRWAEYAAGKGIPNYRPRRRAEEAQPERSLWDWYARESVVPGPYGQPVSEWGPNGPTSWGDPMIYADRAGLGWALLEKGLVYGASALAVVTFGAGIAEMAGIINTAPQGNNVIRVLSKVYQWGVRLDKPEPGKWYHWHSWRW